MLVAQLEKSLFCILKEQLEQIFLNVVNIIGCSCDSVENISGSYNGVQAWIKTMS